MWTRGSQRAWDSRGRSAWTLLGHMICSQLSLLPVAFTSAGESESDSDGESESESDSESESGSEGEHEWCAS